MKSRRSNVRIAIDAALKVPSSRTEYELGHSHAKSGLKRETWVWRGSRASNEGFDSCSSAVLKGIGFVEGSHPKRLRVTVCSVSRYRGRGLMKEEGIAPLPALSHL